jgi:hypothetical protein
VLGLLVREVDLQHRVASRYDERRVAAGEGCAQVEPPQVGDLRGNLRKAVVPGYAAREPSQPQQARRQLERYRSSASIL